MQLFKLYNPKKTFHMIFEQLEINTKAVLKSILGMREVKYYIGTYDYVRSSLPTSLQILDLNALNIKCF